MEIYSAKNDEKNVKSVVNGKKIQSKGLCTIYLSIHFFIYLFIISFVYLFIYYFIFLFSS